MTTVRSPARWAEIDAASPHGPAPTMRTSTSLITGGRATGDGRRGIRNAAFRSDSCPVLPVRRRPPSPRTFYDLVSLRADAHIRDWRLDNLLHAIEIPSGGLGELLDAPAVGRRFAPAIHPLVARDDALLRSEIGWKFLVQLAFVLIAHANTDLLERVEHVELRHGKVGEPVDACRITNDNRV